MGLYTCISCGNEKESESTCSCPICGYKMLKMPYERKRAVASEIEHFLSCLEETSVSREDLIFEGKDKDEAGFPGYDRILQYVSGQARTEGFLAHLRETTEQLRLHISASFSKTYPVSFERLNDRLKAYDEVLVAAAGIVVPDAGIDLPDPAWENVSLLYAERPNAPIEALANELIDRMEKLAEKIGRFIRVNNLYGNNHRYRPPKRGDRYTENTRFPDELKNAISEAETILNKKYVIDIADDGSDELKEMLTCLWNSMELILCAPLFVKSYDYMLEAGCVSEAEFLERLSGKLCERYADVNAAVRTADLYVAKTEDELFEVYRKLIALDTFGFLVPAGTTLINIGESEKKLDELVGLAEIKESIRKIKAYVLNNKEDHDLNIHMCFLGNPGSGKTEVARYMAGILYENKILPTNKVIEVDRRGLVSQYYGATAEKTGRVIEQAMGGVLFIDEAYALGNSADNGTDYGKEAIDTLVKAMEDHRGKFCVILAGYKNEMLRMLATNPGFQSRIPFMLDFPNYSRNELKSIAERMLKARHYRIGDAALSRILDITDIKRREPAFANAREIRNILDQVIMCQNVRRARAEDTELGMVDVNKYIRDAKLNLPVTEVGTDRKVLTAEEELDQLVGLASVKRMVKKIKAYAKRNQGQEGFSLHMCFYGNPGTGKTEVARILSGILYDVGVLPEAKLIETDPHGLLGRFVGETAPKTQEKIRDAMNGVLFIDEAYGLAPVNDASGGVTGYGDEAIAVLLKEMEDHRDRFCVILAGYKEEMRTMLGSNPGLESRIQFTLDFPDYTREELGEIAVSFLRKQKYEIEEAALRRLLDIAEYYRSRPNFANARTVRHIVDQVILNQNLRTEDTDGDRLIVSDDVEDYLGDEGIDVTRSGNGQRRIGFVT